MGRKKREVLGLFRNQLVTVSVAHALFVPSETVMVYDPIDGAVNVAVKLPEESEVVVAKTVEPIIIWMLVRGANPVPLTVTVVPCEQLLGERDIVGANWLLWTTILPPPNDRPVR